jgi:hypothetical protein
VDQIGAGRLCAYRRQRTVAGSLPHEPLRQVDETRSIFGPPLGLQAPLPRPPLDPSGHADQDRGCFGSSRAATSPAAAQFLQYLELSEHNREKVEPVSTVTSADGTTIDYDAYGNGPTVILIGGASQHRAIDQPTSEIAKQLAAEGFTAVDYDRRGRDRSGDTPPWSLGREVEDVAALIEATGAPPPPSTQAPQAPESHSRR